MHPAAQSILEELSKPAASVVVNIAAATHFSSQLDREAGRIGKKAEREQDAETAKHLRAAAEAVRLAAKRQATIAAEAIWGKRNG